MRRGQRDDPGFHHAAIALVGVLVLALVLTPTTAAARAGFSSGGRWIEIDAAYLNRFPAEVRAAIEVEKKICGAVSAVEQSFARYIHVDSSDREFITLHFDHFRCTDRSLICGREGCMHQVFAPVGGGYRLVFTGRVYDVQLVINDGRPAVRLECVSANETRCPRLLLWKGDRLVEGR
jgi:hypothetical protein